MTAFDGFTFTGVMGERVSSIIARHSANKMFKQSFVLLMDRVQEELMKNLPVNSCTVYKQEPLNKVDAENAVHFTIKTTGKVDLYQYTSTIQNALISALGTSQEYRIDIVHYGHLGNPTDGASVLHLSVKEQSTEIEDTIPTVETLVPKQPKPAGVYKERKVKKLNERLKGWEINAVEFSTEILPGVPLETQVVKMIDYSKLKLLKKAISVNDKNNTYMFDFFLGVELSVEPNNEGNCMHPYKVDNGKVSIIYFTRTWVLGQRESLYHFKAKEVVLNDEDEKEGLFRLKLNGKNATIEIKNIRNNRCGFDHSFTTVNGGIDFELYTSPVWLSMLPVVKELSRKNSALARIKSNAPVGLHRCAVINFMDERDWFDGCYIARDDGKLLCLNIPGIHHQVLEWIQYFS